MLDFLHGAMLLFGNALVLVPEGKLSGARFPSWCNAFLGNAFVLVVE